jgi:shikimate dehydrogenase
MPSGAAFHVPESELQEIVCCMGRPVAGNPTQFMMEKAFAAAGLDWRYLTLEVAPEALADAVRGIRAIGFRGANFTIPHKVSVIPLLDELTPAAELMGAVNFVKRTNDRFVGDNTDGKGFVESLRKVLDPSGKKIVLLGAGGAARAIGVELGLAGASEIFVVNRSGPRGEELATLLSQKVKTPSQFVLWKGDYELPPDAAIVVNATSIGLNDPESRVPVLKQSWNPEMVAADVVFSPPQTIFLEEAQSRGCKTLDGLGMLVKQAVIAFRLWTGVEPDQQLMRDAVEEFFGV